ncbi:MAG: hypothetical protein ACYC1Q_12470 [Bacteroidia bacterium]
MKKFILFVLTSGSITTLSAQEKTLVSEGSMKIAGMGEENLYFGFAAGDKIVFSFSEISNKEIKEVEILEYPSASRYTDFKISSASNKIISVNKEGVYQFRFKNGNVAKRVCKYTIERIAASEDTKNFNTSVEWITHTDTVWRTFTKDVTIGHDTTIMKLSRKVVDTVFQKEELLLDKSERVHSTTNSNGNKRSVYFTLPPNRTEAYETTKVVSWAYWVGVGEEANKAWKENAKAISTFTEGAARIFLTPLGALAVGAITDLALPKLGEDVYYALTDETNRVQFHNGQQFRMYDEGKGVAGYKKIVEPGLCQGAYFLCLSNDNDWQGIDVNIKVIAIIETTLYRDEPYQVPIITPIKEKQIFSEPEINQTTVPVIAK